MHVAYDGEQALSIFSRVDPDAALLDVGMPRMSGLDVARAIRQCSSGQCATLIAVTGWGQERDRRTALESGFDYHLTKPIQAEDIQALIDGGRSRGASRQFDPTGGPVKTPGDGASRRLSGRCSTIATRNRTSAMIRVLGREAYAKANNGASGIVLPKTAAVTMRVASIEKVMPLPPYPITA